MFKLYYKKFPLFLLIFSYQVFPNQTFAQNIDENTINFSSVPEINSSLNSESTNNSSNNQADSKIDQTTNLTFPYQQIFTITAYYSPIEGQANYLKGDLEQDLKLNGNGTHGADGTAVFPGMLAAPSKYNFGTKMEIEGLGTFSVHDRGGAIRSADITGKNYDRLDVWMGEGDEGLTRALNWGRRDVKVTVYGLNSEIKESVDWSAYNQPIIKNNSTAKSSSQYQTFLKDLSLGKKDPDVQTLKENLQKLGFYEGKIDDSFDQKLADAVLAFQLNKQIIKNNNDFGSGYFGPQTRKALEQTLKTNLDSINSNSKDNSSRIKTLTNEQKVEKAKNQPKPNSITKLAVSAVDFKALNKDLKVGDSGLAVTQLQQELKKMHLFGLEPTGYYGEVTAHAVFKFQQTQGLATSKSQKNAGIFNAATRNKLSTIIDTRSQTGKIIALKNQ